MKQKNRMRKLFSCLLSLALLGTLCLPAAFAAEAGNAHGQTVCLDNEPTQAKAYCIDGVSYVKLRDAAALLTGTKAQFAATYHAANHSVSLTAGSAYEAVGGELSGRVDGNPGRFSQGCPIELDGEKTELAAYLLGGCNYVKTSELAGLLGISCHQSGDTSSVTLRLDKTGYSMNLSDYAADWQYVTQAIKVDKGNPVYGADGSPVYEKVHPCYMLNVVYCQNPVDAGLQSMTIFVPAEYMTKNSDGTVQVNSSGSMRSMDAEGMTTTYTAQTAPIIFENTIDAYQEGTGFALTQTNKGGLIGTFNNFLESGYVLVDIGSRGKNTTTTDGTAPAAIVLCWALPGTRPFTRHI